MKRPHSPTSEKGRAMLRRFNAGSWAIALFVLCSANPAFANTGALPWDAPLQALTSDLTGPVATAISVCALFSAGAALAFGDDLSHFVRRALLLVIAIAFLVLGSNFLIAIGIVPTSGATI